MDIFKQGLSAIGKLLIAAALAAAFFAGLFGVVYLQLTGSEVEIPKVVGKNFNDGQDELAAMGLRIKKIAARFSNEDPNTILEQRPRAGTVAKTGLIISVVVSEPNPPGTEPPTELKDDEEAIEEIQELPELKTEKSKRQKKSEEDKDDSKTRDVISPDTKPKDDAGQADAQGEPSGSGEGQKENSQGDKKEGGAPPKNDKPRAEQAKPAGESVKPPPSGETRPRKTPGGNN